jgi:hypothetical protein
MVVSECVGQPSELPAHSGSGLRAEGWDGRSPSACSLSGGGSAPDPQRTRRFWTSGRQAEPKTSPFATPADQRPGRPIAGSTRLLVEADHVSCWIAESRSDLGRVRADGLHDLAYTGDDRVKSRGHAVYHDVNRRPGFAPGSAQPETFASRVDGPCV